MAGRWSDDYERGERYRDWRSQDDRTQERDRYGGRGEGRSFNQPEGARRSGSDRDRVFGEQDTGGAYNTPNQPRPGGGGYGAGGSYGRGESYGRGAGGGRDEPSWTYGGHGGGQQGRARGREDFSGKPDWQDRDYGGVSPAMRQGEYDLEQRSRNFRFQSQDYTRGGGRFYGDDGRRPVYRQEYAYGEQPGSYESGYRDYRGGRGQQGPEREFRREEGLYGDRDLEHRYEREMRRPPSGGTGGYDYERGYGDAGRGHDGDVYRGRGDDRGDGGRGGDFLQRAKTWFGNAVGEVRRDLGHEGQGPRRYSSDFGREPRWEPEGHRGRGPKNYKRADDRIQDEVCQRLTDDPWLDASQIDVKVSAGEVTLSGGIENREAKRRAESLAEEVAGVTHVQNDLRVTQSGSLTSPGRGFGDSVLEAQMKRDGQDGGAGGSGGTAQSTDDSAATRSTTRRS